MKKILKNNFKSAYLPVSTFLFVFTATLSQIESSKKNVLDAVTAVKPLQKIILGYLNLYDQLVQTHEDISAVKAVAYSPDNKYMATVNKCGRITIRYAETGTRLIKFAVAIERDFWYYQDPIPIRASHEIYSLSYAGRYLLFSYWYNKKLCNVGTWDFCDGYNFVNVLQENKLLVSEPKSILLSPDAKSLYFLTGSAIFTSDEKIDAYALSPDEKYLAVAAGNIVQVLTNQAREIVLDDEKNSQK